MTASRSSSRYPYKNWQLAAVSTLIPATYGGITLSALVGSLAAAFLGDVPESGGAKFIILMLFALFRYGLNGATVGWLICEMMTAKPFSW